MRAIAVIFAFMLLAGIAALILIDKDQKAKTYCKSIGAALVFIQSIPACQNADGKISIVKYGEK